MVNVITVRVLDLLSQTAALPFALRMRLVDQEVRAWREEKHPTDLDQIAPRR